MIGLLIGILAVLVIIMLLMLLGISNQVVSMKNNIKMNEIIFKAIKEGK